MTIPKPEQAHRLIARQLNKAFPQGQFTEAGFEKFIALVNDSYISTDEERILNQRVVEISQKELLAVNAELEEKNDFLDTFNHGLAHDIKNHTSNILGLITMLRKYASRKDGEMTNTIIEKIDLSAHQLTSIVQGFLYLSRAERLDDQEDKTVNGEQLEQEIILETQSLLQGKQIDLVFDFKQDKLHYSHHILKIIFVNLVSNSIKFSKPGKPNTIRVSLNNSAQEIQLEVQDTGIGMDLKNPENQIFKLFNQPDSTIAKGHGVGLFVIKKIVDKNKGTIKIDSTPGKGTTTVITFPG
jgi:signal transduction histidine kinase